jgi:large exoprotein involved in heme utilization and adhesion
MRDGAAISASTFGAGRGGDLRVTADTMLLEGVGEGEATGLFAQTTTSRSTGDAGELTVNVDYLTMRDGAAIGVSTFGAGRGGHLRVTADTMLLEGVREGNSTGLFAQALSESTGDAGELTVNVDRLTMRDGAAIRTSTFGAGRGGDLRVTADTMLLERMFP